MTDSEDMKGIDTETKAHYAIRRDGNIVTCHCGYVGIADDKYRKHWDSPNTKNAFREWLIEHRVETWNGDVISVFDKWFAEYQKIPDGYICMTVEEFDKVKESSQEFLQGLKARIEEEIKRLQYGATSYFHEPINDQFLMGYYTGLRHAKEALEKRLALLESSEKAKE